MKQSEIKAGRTYQRASRAKNHKAIRRTVVSVAGGIVRWHYAGETDEVQLENLLSTFASWAKSEVKGEGV